MRKIPMRLGDRPVSIKGPLGQLLLKLEDFQASPSRIDWVVSAQGPSWHTHEIRGRHGAEMPLHPLWPQCWIAMSTPVTFHTGSPYRAQFIIGVPEGTVMEA